jgi:hypothetical protein
MAQNDMTSWITKLVKSLIQKDRGSWTSHVQAQFVSAETTDSNLSIITILGVRHRYVRKLASVGALTAGQNVLCLTGGGIPLTIIGVCVGDIRKTV